MNEDKKMEIIENLANGNWSDFKRAIKKCSKLDMLDLIEYYSGNYGGRHAIINQMRLALER